MQLCKDITHLQFLTDLFLLLKVKVVSLHYLFKEEPKTKQTNEELNIFSTLNMWEY